MDILMKLLKILNARLEEVFLVVLLTVAVIIVAMQVITRYWLKMPLPWSEELARYLFIWMTWVGASFAAKERKHINIDVIFHLLPKAGQKACTVISTAIWLFFLMVMIKISMQLTVSVYGGGQIAVGCGVPMWIPYAAIPTGMILMLFRVLQNCYLDFKAATARGDGIEE